MNPPSETNSAVRVRRLVGGDEQDVGADLVDVGEAGDRLVVDSGD
jgi:hypothetical protein